MSDSSPTTVLADLDPTVAAAIADPTKVSRSQLAEARQILSTFGARLGEKHAEEGLSDVDKAAIAEGLRVLVDAAVAIDREIADRAPDDLVASMLASVVIPTADPVVVSRRAPSPAAMRAAQNPRTTFESRPNPERRAAGQVSRRLIAQQTNAVGGIRSGDEVDAAGLGKLVHQAMSSVSRGGMAKVATLLTEYPADRQLDPDDLSANTTKLDAVLSPQSLVASGGVCAPLAADYTVPVFSESATPFLDGMPQFAAPRGGIRYVVPPQIGQFSDGTAVWTAANDANPTSPTTKPIHTQACATEVSVIVDAVPTRIKIGNMQGMFNPELTAANIAYATAEAARIREVNLFSQVLAGSTEVTIAKLLGATPDLLAGVDLAAAAQRYRVRLADTTPLRAVLPDFAKAMLRADMARRLATDSSEMNGGALAVTDAELMDWFAVRNINVTWTMDGVPAQTTGNTYPLQGFAAQTSGVLNDWPSAVVWALFPEGSWQYLDGGRMDFGVIRDSTLDATNDYELMFEPFEKMAYRGVESLKIISQVRPNGQTAATASTTGY